MTFSVHSPVSVSNMAMLCCLACRSTPTIFISASFFPSSFGWYHKSLLGSLRGRRTYVITYTQQWNLGIGHDFGHGWLCSMDYIGSRTIHIEQPVDMNYPAAFDR